MKPFYQICSTTARPDDFINEGYRVINFGMVKNELMNILKDRETAIKYHLFNAIMSPDDNEMMAIRDQLEKIVFKESRGSRSNRVSIGWENGDSYLRYHSGIIYKWFK